MSECQMVHECGQDDGLQAGRPAARGLSQDPIIHIPPSRQMYPQN